MEVLLQTYYTLLPIVATAMVGWVGIILKGQKKKETENDKRRAAQSAGIMMILRYMLQRYHAEYMVQRKITYTQYKNWKDFYKIYKELHGNSVAEVWDDDIEKLEKCESTSEMSLYESLLLKRKND